MEQALATLALVPWCVAGLAFFLILGFLFCKFTDRL